MRTTLRAAALAAMAMLGSSVAMAQRPIEIGFDAGLQFDLESPTTTVFSLPIQAVRFGFFLSDRVALEPNLGINWFKVEGEDAFSTLNLEMGLPYLLGGQPGGTRTYLRPSIGIARVGGGGESVTQFQAGGGIGVKIPAADRMALRLEANVLHGFESDEAASGTRLGLLFGLSFFTR